jgi:hypothetical protein
MPAQLDEKPPPPPQHTTHTGSPLYEASKRAAAALGLPTQCVAADKFEVGPSGGGGGGRGRGALLRNVALQINEKAGGANPALPPGALGAALRASDPMALGADVSHGPGASSVAAVVGSVVGGCAAGPGARALSSAPRF